jgi:hypothetical protein
MPRNILNPNFLRRAHQWFIGLQPVHVQFWIAVTQNAFEEAPHYEFSNSYVGGIADSTQQVFRDQTDFRSGGTVATKTFVVILPYIAGHPVPRKGQMVILYRLDGTVYARAWTTFVQSYDAGVIGSNSNTIYKHECHMTLISGE